ncbi:hypothetical protein BD309DRAFT_877080, partial [Dichomitus squalens]
HTSHLPVSDGGHSQPSPGLGFESGCSSFQYKSPVVQVRVCLGAHDPQVTWHRKTVTVSPCVYLLYIQNDIATCQDHVLLSSQPSSISKSDTSSSISSS